MRSRAPLLIFLALLIAGIPATAEFYTDWLWFTEVGYEQVFLRSLTVQALVAVGIGVVSFALLGGSLVLALRALRPRPFMVATPQGPQTITIDPSTLRPLVLLAAAVVSLMIGLFAGGRWELWLYYLYATPFGTTDPILGHDIGFYVFTLPLLEHLEGLLLFLFFSMTAATAVAYLFGGDIALHPVRGITLSRAAIRHLGVMAAGLLLVLAFGAWLQIPGLLTARSGVVWGASYVDVHASMPALRLLSAAGVIGAGIALWAAFSGAGLARLALAGALYVLVALAGPAYAAVIQRFVVAPNEQVRETPFITHNIQATRAAFALDAVLEKPLSGEAHLTRADLERNAATIENVPLWNDRPLLDTFGQLQEIRTYYDFVAVDNDRYTIDGEYRQIMLSGRELNSTALPNRTWINERLTFTHGYGVTLGPVNQVTPEGLPVLFIKDLPPQSSVDLQVEQPAIYFGQLSSDHVFVRSRAREFHYPKGDDNVYTSYDGSGGVPLSNVFRRALFAARFGSLKVMLSDDITAESRVLFYRRIGERVRRIAPFLRYEPEPYLLISNGRLVWVQDAYTTTSRYPYSSPAHDGTNYIRNSVKITVDAYDGTVRFYVIDERDPIVRTYAAAFPGLFRPAAEMPADIRARLRYPEEIFRMQTAMYSTFHMTNPAVFYNKEDQWEVPALDPQRGGPMQPYYTIMKLPGESSPEFIQMLPFTPSRKDNLAAWMVARSDGEHYGRMLVFQFPKQKVVFGPRQIVGRINQDQAIAPQITLWNQQGSQVLQGTLLIIPIEESLLYIRPMYLRAAGGRIPELKRVIVAYQNQIVMEETLDQALDRLFPVDGQRVPAAAPPVDNGEGAVAAAEVPEPGLPARALEHYRRALDAQRSGDWGRYGEEIRRLGELLEEAAPRR